MLHILYSVYPSLSVELHLVTCGGYVTMLVPYAIPSATVGCALHTLCCVLLLRFRWNGRLAHFSTCDSSTEEDETGDPNLGLPGGAPLLSA